jgi:hypothetical protein
MKSVMINRLRIVTASAAILSSLPVVSTADGARQARCFTSDDGAYSCDLRVTDALGSLLITATGKPTYILQVTDEDTAVGFAITGDDTVSLPAEFHRRQDDAGCWQNTLTGAEICAW